MANLSAFGGPGGWNDPDFLMTGLTTEGLFGLSEIDWKTEFSFWCLFAAPLVVATDVRKMDNKVSSLNRRSSEVPLVDVINRLKSY